MSKARLVLSRARLVGGTHCEAGHALLTGEVPSGISVHDVAVAVAAGTVAIEEVSVKEVVDKHVEKTSKSQKKAAGEQ